MTNRLRLLLALIISLLAGLAAAEGEATWSVKMDRADVRAGEVAKVIISAKLKQGWHTYSIIPVADGPFPTTIQPPTGDVVEGAGPIGEQPPKVEMDTNFGKKVGTFTGSAEFYVPIRVKSSATGTHQVALKLRYMVCNDHTCLPPNDASLFLGFAVQPGSARPEFSNGPSGGGTVPSVDQFSDQVKHAIDAGWLPLILLAVSFGFLSLLTPCVFPMIPITVSFFSKQKTDDEKLSFAGPVAYCLGIIATFTGLGVIIGSTGLQRVATNIWVNAALAVLFIVLAANLFGVYEIRLPGWLINRAATKSRSGGLAGPLFMGLTFTMTSFTCTVPFVGTLLLKTAQNGLAASIVGMLAYSTAFALPFFLLALFPSFLSKLPRSGAWLVTVKAFMGFLELMAALKFVSNVELGLKLGWITRPVFLAVWAITAAIGGLYLLGWLRLPHDEGATVGWIRRGFGVATLGLAVFCLSGMNGVYLGNLEAFPPPDPYPYLPAGRSGAKSADGLEWGKSYEA
ncbi:MAG: cytochrome c biogenesis protein CcdA, partial [Fimbriimonadales bacterium]